MREAGATPALGLQPCLAGRADGALAALLDDGTVAILSIDGEAATTHEVVRLEGGGAQAVACSADGALLAVASASALGVYELVADGAGRWRARLRWRAQLRAHARALALASSASAGVAVAVGGAPGLLLFGDAAAAAAAAPTTSAGEQREGVLLHRGAVVVCCSLCASAERLAVATLDGRLLVHRAAAAGWQRGPPALIWSARLPCERACSLSWAADGRWIAVASWQADVALYDAAEYAADGAPPPLGAGATVGAAATAARRRAQEWRLATVRAPQQPQPAGPVVLVWAAAPHAAGTLVCAQPAAPAAPAQSGAAAPRQRLEAWRAAVDGSPLPFRAAARRRAAPRPVLRPRRRVGAALLARCGGRAALEVALGVGGGGQRRGAGRGGRRRAAAAGRGWRPAAAAAGGGSVRAARRERRRVHRRVARRRAGSVAAAGDGRGARGSPPPAARAGAPARRRRGARWHSLR